MRCGWGTRRPPRSGRVGVACVPLAVRWHTRPVRPEADDPDAVPVLRPTQARWPVYAERPRRRTRQFLADVADLLALRALAHGSPRRLARAVPDGATGWRRGDPHVLACLAELELARLGLRAPTFVRAPTPPEPSAGPSTGPSADPTAGRPPA